MAFSRAAAIRSCFRGARPTSARPQLFRQVVRRGYASGGHESAKAGGDAVWAAGAVAVTAPTVWYLLQNAPEAPHGHGDHGDSHGKSHGEEAKEESKDEPEKKSEEEPEASDEEKSEDSDSEGEAKEADTPDTSDDEGGEDAKKDGNTVKSDGEPDDKASASKPAEGKSTTEIANKSDKSTKGEGTPETSKSKGAVDPNRPQV